MKGIGIDVRSQVTTPSQAVSILLIGCPDAAVSAIGGILTSPDWEIRPARVWIEAEAILDASDIGVVICHAEVEDGSWREVLGNLQARRDPPNLIVSSRMADERLWTEVLNLGGYDLLMQPFERSEVLRVAQLAWMAWMRARQTTTARAAHAQRG
jgi:DNA-binding NtrC family response regulator